MKFVPRPLPPIPTGGPAMDRFPLPLPLPFSPDMLWRYPLGFPSLGQPTATSPLLDYKSQLPTSLAADPRIWSREDVVTFLRWAEREFDLQPFDMDVFQMNGKAMCLLTRNDLSERVPGSGDLLHNILQLLVREANNLQRCLPSSPITPTSRHPYPLSPHTAQPPTPNWNLLTQTTSNDFHPHHAAQLAAIMAQSNSVTLSPAPSVDSQAGGSPQHAETTTAQPSHAFNHSIFGSSSSGGSNQSDSDEELVEKNASNISPPNTPTAYTFFHPPAYQFPPVKSPKEEVAAVASPSAMKREFFPSDTSPEPNTNGRLLWDFLQQLLNDPNQRYTNFIAWKNQDTGVFKIVDPAGLAKLWGIQKNHLSMNYDKMSRALRYYYRVNILRKVQGERHCYQFLRNPTELKNIKNISLLRQQMSPTRVSATGCSTPAASSVSSNPVKPEPVAASTACTTTSWTKSSESAAKAPFIKTEPETGGGNYADYGDEMPTDLSMNATPTDLSHQLCKASDASLRIFPADKESTSGDH